MEFVCMTGLNNKQAPTGHGSGSDSSKRNAYSEAFESLFYFAFYKWGNCFIFCVHTLY